MNNQAQPVMMGNMSKGICIMRKNNQHYLSITDTLCIIIAIMHE